MEQLNYKIDVFEGPMDLLLHLISKHKLNINDIPIVELVNQYLDYVRQMQEQAFASARGSGNSKKGTYRRTY